MNRSVESNCANEFLHFNLIFITESSLHNFVFDHNATETRDSIVSKYLYLKMNFYPVSSNSLIMLMPSHQLYISQSIIY